MIRIGYAPGAFDLFHIGHLNLLRRAKERCDFLIAGVVADEVLIQHKKVTPVIPVAERLEIVRNVKFVDMALAAMINDKTEIWRELRFNVLFKGNDWQGTEKGNRLEREFAALGVDVVYFPYTQATSSSALRPDTPEYRYDSQSRLHRCSAAGAGARGLTQKAPNPALLRRLDLKARNGVRAHIGSGTLLAYCRVRDEAP